MKKLIAMLLAVVMIVGLAACGTINETEATYAVTYVNDYKAEGDINLGVTKALKNENDQQMTLVDNMFKFTLTRNGKTYTAYNAADGTVTFPPEALTFTQEDMAGATLGTDGYMSKEVNVVISEGRGTLDDTAINAYNTTNSANFDYNKVRYEKDKVIPLRLTDKGNGTIEVAPANWPGYADPTLGYTYDNTTMTVSVGFDNKLEKKAKAKLDGTKTMVGDKLSKAQFTFNAKLIRVNDTDVSEAGQAAARKQDENLPSWEGPHFLDDLMAQRAQASPVDFSGYNEATPTDAAQAAQGFHVNQMPSLYSFR